MSVLLQITLGSTLLVFCTLIQIGTQVLLVRKLRRGQYLNRVTAPHMIYLLCASVAAVLLAAHTVHVYLWAISLWLLGALPGYEEPIYFTLVTYTTVGYGDVTLSPQFRIFGAMASVNGVLAFGLTTAFLVGLFPKIIVALRDD